MHRKKYWLMSILAAGLAGCSADPYRAPMPAPPDFERSPGPLEPPAPPTGEAPPSGAVGCVPIGDGSERLAPNYSGYIPRVSE